jgi:hypothetical protein
MMRESLDSDAPAVTMLLGSTGWRIAAMGIRSTAGGSMDWMTGNQYTWIPVWLRLQRSGNSFTGYQSSNGVAWFPVGTTTVPMNAKYYVGLAASSGDTKTGTVETSTFDNTRLVCPMPHASVNDRQHLRDVDDLRSCELPETDDRSGSVSPIEK